MAKLITPEEKRAAIIACFNYNKSAQVLHVTGDGQCFLEASKNAANNHARRHQLSVESVKREDFASDLEVQVDNKPKTYADMTVAELKAKISERGLDAGAAKKKQDFIDILDADDAAKAKSDKTEITPAAPGTEGAGSTSEDERKGNDQE